MRVKSYQHRHGIEEDGKLTPQTIKSMNVPLTERVVQLQDSLERWRWLPDEYLNAPLIVNLPEFVLRGYTPEHKPDFTMKVVVGKVVGEHRDAGVCAHDEVPGVPAVLECAGGHCAEGAGAASLRAEPGVPGEQEL